LFPIIGDDRIAVVFYRNSGKAEGIISGVDPGDGRLLWQKEYAGLSEMTINPVFSKGKASFASGDNETGKSLVMILNTYTGSEISRIPLNEAVSGLSLYGGYLYITTVTGTVYCYDIGSDRISWEHRTGFGPRIITSDDGGIYIFGHERMMKLSR
jgi:outer membrane protein assembly factor BamB